MGSIISSANYNDDPYRKSNVKLQAQSVPPFNGDPHKWQTWKKKSRAAIGTAGLLRILDDATYASNHVLENETIFHLLQVATTEGNASFLVDQFEDDRDGRKAFEALEKWFEGMKLQNETAEDIRSKLDKNMLTTKVTATRYINLFLSYTKQLKDLDESYTKSKTVSMFLENITNPDYQSTVELCLSHKYDLHECIMQIRAKERRLEREEAVQRRAKISVRRNHHHEQPQEMETERDKNNETEIDIEKYKTELGYYSIPSEIWRNLKDAQKTKIKQSNSNLRKRRRASEHHKNEETTISPRRIGHLGRNVESASEHPNKRQKMVNFDEEESNHENESQEVEEDTQEISNRRAILRFKTKPKETGN